MGCAVALIAALAVHLHPRSSSGNQSEGRCANSCVCVTNLTKVRAFKCLITGFHPFPLTHSGSNKRPTASPGCEPSQLILPRARTREGKLCRDRAAPAHTKRRLCQATANMGTPAQVVVGSEPGTDVPRVHPCVARPRGAAPLIDELGKPAPRPAGAALEALGARLAGAGAGPLSPCPRWRPRPVARREAAGPSEAAAIRPHPAAAAWRRLAFSPLGGPAVGARPGLLQGRSRGLA